MIKIASALTLLLLSLASTLTNAGATLHIGSGYGTACATGATGGCPIYGTEVNNINAVIDIYQNAANAPALNSPVYLILGVANTPSASSVIEHSVLNASLINTSGQSTAVSTAFDNYAGAMTSSDVYSFLNLSGDKSNSFTNWSAAALAVDGIQANNFGIYLFSLYSNGFAGNDYLNIHTNLLPEGTFAVAYGTDSSGKSYSTAFTNAGMRDTPPRPSAVPEPMPLVLICLGLFGIAFITKRKISA
ncbi:PEP-CTERM sorting domain-containing protein [Ferrovum myxofaciens]|uniref:PEP-CTERM sorting domain-containing protein n=1 Tax=Ferrovum myxofaciens TaxID=416213 RepID=A0A9E6MXC6_9PROT|nr:PEP-CTERM sorting domain-containing protein [Ferrovum myxofaciens]MBU6995247.1 PEP-CTERM sorting domain-containing protein [Ferrovum myxofaciens]QKE39122.1 MAG: PEP-CTERM sorting domain-containing protein [Ferrovum myxofaciens]QWY74360.1 MAG: PEP-CTERM sorting domain-containing protein [Ferrovum myxofaciens]QWY77111.1 MAG: PEP-CTERM sorting domain-containing protein [Ferrovum myxofaciens]